MSIGRATALGKSKITLEVPGREPPGECVPLSNFDIAEPTADTAATCKETRAAISANMKSGLL